MTWLHRPEDDIDYGERRRQALDEREDDEQRAQARADRAAERADLVRWEPDAHRLARRERQKRAGTEGEEPR